MKRFRPDEAAEQLAVTRRTIYRWLRNGVLKSAIVRGRKMVDPESLSSASGPLMRPSEAAQLLAVSKSTIYRWVEEGIIRGIKIGGSIRVMRTEIEALINPQNL